MSEKGVGESSHVEIDNPPYYEIVYLGLNISTEIKMKNLFIALFVVGFTVAGTAQTKSLSKIKKDAKSEVSAVSENQDKQIAEALMKDKDLQNQTVEFLMNNEDTKEQVAKISSKVGDSKKSIMDGILKNEALTTAAVDYVKNNPDLLEKAMKLIGM